jgi:hypothetical protein
MTTVTTSRNATILRSLPEPWRLGTLVLVAGFVDRIDRLAILRSDADPLVPAAHTDRLAALLGTSAQVVPGAGHFLASDGVTSLPEALEAVAPQAQGAQEAQGARS